MAPAGGPVDRAEAILYAGFIPGTGRVPIV